MSRPSTQPINHSRRIYRRVYEAVTARPAGTATAARLVATAADYGYDGIILRRSNTSTEPNLESVRDQYGIDVVEALEIDTTDPAVLSGTVGAERTNQTVIIVRGGTEVINRHAVENPRVDILASPMRDRGDINHVLAKAAAANNVRLEVNLGRILRDNSGSRVKAVSELRKLREVTADASAPIVVSARPESHYHVRAPRELIAVGAVIGFEADHVASGLAEWGNVIEENRHRLANDAIEPGVEVESNEGTDK